MPLISLLAVNTPRPQCSGTGGVMKRGVHARNFVLRETGNPVCSLFLDVAAAIGDSFLSYLPPQKPYVGASFDVRLPRRVCSLSREQNHRSRSAPAGASNHALHIHNNASMNIQAGMQTPLLTHLFSPAWLFVPPSLLSPCIPPSHPSFPSHSSLSTA